MSRATEQSVLGCCSADPKAFHAASAILTVDDFAFPEHRAIWRLLADMVEEGCALDAVTISEFAENRGVSDTFGGLGYLLEIHNTAWFPKHAEHYAKMVSGDAMRRRINAIGRSLAELELTGDEALDEAHRLIGSLSSRASATSVSIKDALKDVYRRMEERFSGVSLPVTPTPWDGLNTMLGGGLGNGKLYIVGGRPGMGKEQPNSASVLTADGEWKRMGDIRVGDSIASVDGAESVVSGVYPQGTKDVYEFAFSDGRRARAGMDHLWEVTYRDWQAPRVKSTAEILAMLQRSRYKNRLSVRLFSGEFGKRVDLPIDPWLLGMLLGDGNFTITTPRITSADDCILERIRSLLPPGYELKKCGKYDFRISGRKGAKNWLTEILKGLNLWGCYSHEKRIPPQYMTASREQRIELLRGLIDSDGWVESFGPIRFCASSVEFAQDVRQLAMSLGCICSITEKQTSHRVAYVLNIRHSAPNDLCWLERKRQRIRARRCELSLTIRSVELVGREPSTCIRVTHPSHLYITDNYVTTHNTAFMRGVSVAAADIGHACIISLEMDREEVAGMMLAGAANVSYQHIRDPRNMPGDDWAPITAGNVKLGVLPISICDMPALSLPAITAECRRLSAKARLSVVVIDYLGLIDLPEADRQDIAIGKVTRGLKRLAREIDAPVVLLCQLSRNVESRADKRPMLSDLRDAGQIEQDADGIMFLYRDRYYNPQSHFGNIAEIGLAKQRGGRTGIVPVVFREEQIEFVNYAGDWPLKRDESDPQPTAPKSRGFRK